MVDDPFGDNGQRFARSYSQTSPYTDTAKRRKAISTALGGEDAAMASSPYQPGAMTVPTSPQLMGMEAPGIAPGEPVRSTPKDKVPGMMGQGAAMGAQSGLRSSAMMMNPYGPQRGNGDWLVGQAQRQIADAYQQHLGREASPQEIAGQLVGQGWNPAGGDRFVGQRGLQAVLGSIANSPEAAAYLQSQQAPQPGAPAAPGAAAPLDKSQWDTDGYATPNTIAQNFGAAPVGFEASNWDNPNVQTPKYVIGRLAQEVAAQTGGFNADFEKVFGERLKEVYGDHFRYLGADKVVGADGYPVDFVVGWGAPGARVDWQTSNPGDPMPMGLGAAAGAPAPINLQSNIDMSSNAGARAYLEQILAALQGNPALKRALSGTL